MNSKATIGLVILAGALAFFGFCLALSRRFQTVTVARLVREIPPDLRMNEGSNRASQERYQKLIALSATIGTDVDGLPWFTKDHSKQLLEAKLAAKYASTVSQAEEILHTGNLQVVSGPTAKASRKALNELDKLIAITDSAAMLRKDPASALRYAKLEMTFARSLKRARGTLSDQWLATTVEWDAFTAYHGVEQTGLLSETDRKAFLTEFPADRGIDPALAEAFKRGLIEIMAPDVYRIGHPAPTAKPRRGGYDPVATMKMYVRLYREAIDDALNPAPRSWQGTAKLQEAIYKRALSEYRVGSKSGPGRFLLGLENAYGDWTVAKTSIVEFLLHSRQEAAHRNLVREMMLLRHGQSETLPDPLGDGNLQVDPKRRIIWSVGMNGIDEGGKYGAPGSYAGDLIMRY